MSILEQNRWKEPLLVGIIAKTFCLSVTALRILDEQGMGILIKANATEDLRFLVLIEGHFPDNPIRHIS